MKTQTILPVLLALMTAACNNDKTRSSIEGTYVNTGESEYSKVKDTLVIEESEGNTFLIHRKTGFQLIKDGKPGKEQYEKEEWKALYDEDKKVLTETSRGKIITPLPEANKLLVEKSEFIKVN